MRLTRLCSAVLLSAVLGSFCAPVVMAQGHPANIPLGGVAPSTETAPSGQPKQLDEFVPIDQLPQTEQIPAANLLIPAYAFVWVAVLAYVISLSRRLGAVEQDMQRLEKDIAPGKSR